MKRPTSSLPLTLRPSEFSRIFLDVDQILLRERAAQPLARREAVTRPGDGRLAGLEPGALEMDRRDKTRESSDTLRAEDVAGRGAAQNPHSRMDPLECVQCTGIRKQSG